MISKKEILSLAELAKLSLSEAEVLTLEKQLNQQLENITEQEILNAAWEMSTLARIDGIRFKPWFENAQTLEEVYVKTRTNHFDLATKKQILLGFYVVLEENYNKYFKKAWKQELANKVELEQLRDDQVEPSLPRKEIMEKAPKTDGEFFVVPLVVE